MGKNERSFVIQVHGVHFSNPDGGSRQEVIARCRRGQRIEFEPEPTNPHDANAVKVLAVGQTIGYIPAKLSARFAEQLRDGEIIAGSINKIYVLDDGTSGVELRVRLREGAEVPAADAQEAGGGMGCLVLIILAILIYVLGRAFGCKG
jgi:hypothetical protein